MTATDESKDHLIDILKSYTTAMFITMEADGTAHARPMSIASVGPENVMLLVTSVKSPTVANIVLQPMVYLFFHFRSVINFRKNRVVILTKS